MIIVWLVAITSRNSGTVRTRTVGSSLYNMAIQTSNIISSQVSSTFSTSFLPNFLTCKRFQIYRNNDKPLYRKGNKVLLAIAAYNCLLFVGAKCYYVWKNKYDLLVHTLFEHLTNQETQVSVMRFGTIWPTKKGYTILRPLKTRAISGKLPHGGWDVIRGNMMYWFYRHKTDSTFALRTRYKPERCTRHVGFGSLLQVVQLSCTFTTTKQLPSLAIKGILVRK